MEHAIGQVLAVNVSEKRGEIKQNINEADIMAISRREDEGLLRIKTSTPKPQTNNFLRRHMARY